MAKFRDWTGVRQGNLLITRKVGTRYDGNALWETKCDCGSVTVKPNTTLSKGTKTCSTACGVARSNRQRARHGFAKTKEYRAWQSAKQRCINPKHPQYRNYGARGIHMHQAWADDFTLFLKDVGPAPGEGRQVSIDRIDNEKGYVPGNVRWANQKDQINNRRVTKTVNVNGVHMTVSELCEKYNLPYTTVEARVRKGVSGDDLTAPRKRVITTKR